MTDLRRAFVFFQPRCFTEEKVCPCRQLLQVATWTRIPREHEAFALVFCRYSQAWNRVYRVCKRKLHATKLDFTVCIERRADHVISKGQTFKIFCWLFVAIDRQWLLAFAMQAIEH